MPEVFGGAHLTSLGRRVASGGITRAEFAALMVQQTVLPNPATYTVAEIEKWRAAGIKIYPLKLILEVLAELGRKNGSSAASLNNDELTKVVIPLAGANSAVQAIALDVMSYRHKQLNVSTWPDCAPAANDIRLAREFLLFLANFGLLRAGDAQSSRDEQRFYLDEIFDVDEATAPIASTIFGDEASAAQAVVQVQHSPLPSIIERQRRTAQVLSRPGQSKFRLKIFEAFEGKCFLTGEEISEVLEAAHIIPVTNNGSDSAENGLCLRVDIHRLFDSGHLRISPDGSLSLSDAVAGSSNYGGLPQTVQFPQFVNLANIAWRDSYL